MPSIGLRVWLLGASCSLVSATPMIAAAAGCWVLLVCSRSMLLVCTRGPALRLGVSFGVSCCCFCWYTYSQHRVSL